MDESSKLLLTVAIPTVTVLVGILVNNRQFDQLDRHMNQQVLSLRNELHGEIASLRGETTSLRSEMTSLRNEMMSLRNEMIARLERVEGVLDARLKQVEDILRLR